MMTSRYGRTLTAGGLRVRAAPAHADQRGKAVLGHQSDRRKTAVELRRAGHSHSKRCPGRAIIARQEGVVDVVDQRRDHDLVDRDQGDRVGGRPGARRGAARAA